ncbi:SPOSA6832_01025, partial [Sporobolomyces salmonicolor]
MTSFPPFYTTRATLTKDNWRAKVAEKKAAQAALIPDEWRLSPELLSDPRLDVTGVVAECGILTDKELEITELDEVEELASRLAKGVYNAVEVTTAFCKRASVAQQLTNCLTEIFFERALERAKELDEILKTTGKPVGPLRTSLSAPSFQGTSPHAFSSLTDGVPISLKDQFDIAGTELTMGYVSYLGRISERDSALVRLLLDAGAIIHVRTNVPQTLMVGDTVNYLFGRTHNPLNRKLSPGGSSGGEGALIAMKGSILGVGTDIGGSVRIPSSFCGLHTIRPTTRRVPYGHATNSLVRSEETLLVAGADLRRLYQLGQESVLSVAGPMSRSLSSCTYFLKTVLNANPADYDASSLPFPFNDTVYSEAKARKKLAFGIMRTDYNVTPTPPIKRALETAAAKLEKAGHEGNSVGDGGEDFKRILAAIEEPLIPGLSITPDELKTTYEVWQLNRQKEALQQAFLAKWLATAGQTSTGRPIDGLLCPVAPVTACIPGGNPWAGYTGMFNLLDAPAVVLPVTRVDPTVDVKPATFEPLSSLDSQFYHACAMYGILLSSPPVTRLTLLRLCSVGKRWRDEELLGIGEVAAKAISALA